MKFILIVFSLFLVSGCVERYPQAYPVIQCDENAPDHIELRIKYNKDAIETAKVMIEKNWTNVGYDLPEWRSATVWGDCEL